MRPLPSIHEQLEEAGLAFVYRNVYPSGGPTDLAGAGGSAHVPAMPAEMPDVSFDRRDRADALPTASTGAAVPPSAPSNASTTAEGLAAAGSQPSFPAAAGPVDPMPLNAVPTGRVAAAADTPPLTPGEQALLEHVRQHEGRAEVICIVRPHGAATNSSEVFVLNGAGSDFVDHLSRAHHGAAASGRSETRSDVALLPSANPFR